MSEPASPPTRDHSLALAGRTSTSKALLARKASLEYHNILGRVPLVTPVMMIPGTPSESVFHMQEMGTGKHANLWDIAVYDTGADITLCSKRFAERNGLEYGLNRVRINTANGDRKYTLGELLRPMEFWLAHGTDAACVAVTTVQVLDVGELYDIILSTEVLSQWGACVNFADSQLYFYPDWWTMGSLARIRSIPVRCVPKDGSKAPSNPTSVSPAQSAPT
jgi:hypothetical protein